MAFLLNNINLLINVENQVEGNRGRRRQFTRERHLCRRLRTEVALNDEMFKQNFRLSRNSFEVLINELGPHLRQGQTPYAVSTEKKLLAALRFYAHGSYQLSVGNDTVALLSQSAVSRILHEVMDCINDVLCIRLITLPTNDDMKRTSARILRNYLIPGVIGLIDCTHLCIVGPKNDADFPEFVYVNRKNQHSLNVQIICNDEYKIWNVNARFPGLSHDSFIWKQCFIRTYLLDNYGNGRRWLLGDSGYQLEPILLVPFRNAQNPGAEMFNERYHQCRSTVERCIGVLKSQWRCLHLERETL